MAVAKSESVFFEAIMRLGQRVEAGREQLDVARDKHDLACSKFKLNDRRETSVYQCSRFRGIPRSRRRRQRGCEGTCRGRKQGQQRREVRSESARPEAAERGHPVVSISRRFGEGGAVRRSTGRSTADTKIQKQREIQ